MDKKKNTKQKILYKFKIIVILFTTIISFIYTIQFLDNINLKVDDLFLATLINSSNHIESEGLSTNVVNYVAKLDFLNPLNLLKTNYKGLVNIENKIDESIISQGAPVINNQDPIESPTKIPQTKPIVYIFNTHQAEEYATKNLSPYHIKPTVLLASYILQDKLDRLDIPSIVEENNVTELLRINNWNYASSYKITRMLMEQAYKDNPSLLYFIDLHRDSVNRDKTTITIDNKTYAKVLFLLGLENENYQQSEAVISKMNTIINDKYPGISKGIYKKSGPGVNGVYNQDFSSRCILIEVGGVDNTIEEVSNTIDAIAYMLNAYMESVV